jgi:alpha-glucoside transport system substrate-binding protein
MSRSRIGLGALAALVLVAVAAGCGGSSKKSSGTTTGAASTNVKGSLSFVGVWTADEQKSFRAVLDAFQKKYPNVKVKYTSAGNNVPTVLSTAIQGGKPPDLASIAQPGLVKQFATAGNLQPIDFAKSEITSSLPEGIVSFGTINGKLYGFLFKGSNKSTVWYNVSAFKNAGVTPPKTWPDFLKAAKTLKASGTPAYSLGGSEGWTLTDLFENIYIRTAGPDKYDQLTDHKIKWTDPSVKEALRTMADIVGDTGNIFGGTSGALQTDFPTSVSNVFQDPPKAAMVIEGDFVPGVVATSTKLKPISGYNVFDFPSINGSAPAVVAGGDTVVMFRNSPAARALVSYLASSEAATIWAKRGGFSSPNKKVPASAYSDSLTRKTATALANAKTLRFDLSDLEPAAFGGTAGQGEWKLFQDFVQNPKNVDGIASQLESAAAKAFKK